MKPEGGLGGAAFAPPPAVITGAIVVLCVLVEVVLTLAGPSLRGAVGANASLIPARLTGVFVARPGAFPAVATLLTSLFLHAGWLHLIVNLTFLLWIGRHVEAVAGHLRFAAIYLLGGIAGGLLQVAVAPHSTDQVIGASGAIAGVFGAYAVLFARSRLAARRVLGVTIAGEVLTAGWYLATWIALQLLTGLAFNRGGGGIAIWTHIGGFAVGLVASHLLVRRLR